MEAKERVQRVVNNPIYDDYAAMPWRERNMVRWELNRPYSQIAEIGYYVFTISASVLLIDCLVAIYYTLSTLKNNYDGDGVWKGIMLTGYISAAGTILGGITGLTFAIISLARIPPQLRLTKNLALHDSGLGLGLTLRF